MISDLNYLLNKQIKYCKFNHALTEEGEHIIQCSLTIPKHAYGDLHQLCEKHGDKVMGMYPSLNNLSNYKGRYSLVIYHCPHHELQVYLDQAISIINASSISRSLTHIYSVSRHMDEDAIDALIKSRPELEDILRPDDNPPF